jgi:hypothetical protein
VNGTKTVPYNGYEKEAKNASKPKKGLEWRIDRRVQPIGYVWRRLDDRLLGTPTMGANKPIPGSNGPPIKMAMASPIIDSRRSGMR